MRTGILLLSLVLLAACSPQVKPEGKIARGSLAGGCDTSVNGGDTGPSCAVIKANKTDEAVRQ